MTTKQMNAGIRIASMVIDHFIMTIIVALICAPFLLTTMANAFEVSHYSNDTPTNYSGSLYIMLFGMTLYLCKDSFGGRSVAKRILRHQVIDRKTGLPANPIKCMVRNIFCMIWPVEVIMVLINPSRRIGDRVAGTEVVYYDPEKEKPKLQISKIALAIVIAYGALFLLSLPFVSLTSNVVPLSEKIDETFYNKELSENSIKGFNDSLHEYLTADIRIYDKTKTSSKMYISAIFNLKEDYEIDDEDYGKLKQFCYHLFVQIVNKPFTGRMQFVYNHKNKVNIRETKMEH